jgi:hypothetical protein
MRQAQTGDIPETRLASIEIIGDSSAATSRRSGKLYPVSTFCRQLTVARQIVGFTDYDDMYERLIHMPFASREWRLMLSLFLAVFLATEFNRPAMGSDDVLLRLEARVAADPDRGSSWRLLGRKLLELQDYDAAYDALSRAIDLVPESAAAWSDFGRAAVAKDESRIAVEAFQMVVLLAPESDYAASALQELQQLETSGTENPLQTASYEIRSFDGAEVLNRLEDTDPPRRRWIPDSLQIRLDTGLMFNSNVALSPVSRQLAPGERASFQFFAAPDIQWAAIDKPNWRTGPTFRGRFTLNEGNFRRFNLQSYRPGWFSEWFIFRGDQIIVPRIAYDFTHDAFGGSTLGKRHGLLASVSGFWSDQHASFLYWSADRTDFVNDGILPDVTSQDGWTNAIGVSHDVVLPYRYFRLVRGGVDVSQTDTVGSDYRFRGVNIFVDGVAPITETVEMTISGGWGYRDFFDYEFEPSRNEILWRGGVELRKFFSPGLSVAAVCDFNRFDSENPLFSAERLILGTIAEFEY